MTTQDAPDADERRKRLLLLMTPNTYRASAFVDAAERLGVEVVRGLDLPKALNEYWDVRLKLDFNDPDASVAAIVAYAREQPFDAIFPVDDGATLLAARASAALGLPYNPLEAAEIARDKGRMRPAMAAAGVPCPAFERYPLASDPAELAARMRYPCVLKPLRLSGSRGVMRADDPEQFVTDFERLKRLLLGDGERLDETDILVEDFIPGFEVAVEGLLTEGRLHVLALFDKPDPLDGPFFEETIYVTPSRLPEATQRAIADCAEQAARSIGLRDGPIHAELRVNEQGPWMVEIAGRSIGGLCSTVLEFGTGMCLEEILLRHALKMELPSLSLTGSGAGAMMIPIPKGGMLHGVSGIEEAEAVPHVVGVEITTPLHSQIVPLPEGSSYLGFIFARADDPATAEQALRDAHAKLRFDIRRMLPMMSAQPMLQ